MMAQIPAPKKLGLLFTASSEGAQFPQALALAQEALQAGGSVYWYSIDEGVRAVPDPGLQALKKNPRFHLYACAYGAQRRGLPMDDAAAYAGLTIVADMIANTDRFVAFGDLPMSEPLAVLPKLASGELVKTLVITSQDPRTSARPAEAIRIAAGVGAWKKTEVSLLLLGEAGYCLSDEPDEFLDEDNFTRYRPIIAEWKRPIYVDESFNDPEVLAHAALPFERVSQEKIAQLRAQAHAVIEL